METGARDHIFPGFFVHLAQNVDVVEITNETLCGCGKKSEQPDFRFIRTRVLRGREKLGLLFHTLALEKNEIWELVTINPPLSLPTIYDNLSVSTTENLVKCS